MLQHRRPRAHTVDTAGTHAASLLLLHADANTTNNSTDANNNNSNSNSNSRFELSILSGAEYNNNTTDDDTPPRRKQGSSFLFRPTHVWKNVFRRLLRKGGGTRRLLLGVLCLVWVGWTLLSLWLRRRLGSKSSSSSVLSSHEPFPPAHIQISVIVMNHARPYLLQHSNLLPVLVHHPAVSEIFILHSNPATAFGSAELSHLDMDTQKIHHVPEAAILNDSLGLAIRFHYCATLVRTNEWILHVDDDMELDASAINMLVAAMMDNPRRIVGHYGRRYSTWAAPTRCGYDTTDRTGDDLEVVLTKILLLQKDLCREFQTHLSLMADMVPHSHPLWNGEDIFVNLVANHYYNVPYNGPYRNYAIPDLAVWDADTSRYPEPTNRAEELSISGNMDRHRVWNVGPIAFLKAVWKAQEHTAYRGRLWYRAKRRLAGYAD